MWTFSLHARAWFSQMRDRNNCVLRSFLWSNIVCRVREEERCDLGKLQQPWKWWLWCMKEKAKKTNQEKPKHVKLKEESVKSSVMPAGTSGRLEWIIANSCSHRPCDLTLLWAFAPWCLGLNIFPSYCPCKKQWLFLKGCMISFHFCLYLAILQFTRLVSHTLPGVFSILV